MQENGAMPGETGETIWSYGNRKAPAVRRELYYYDTSDGFEAARLAARLYSMLKEELQRAQKEKVLFLALARIGLRETAWDR